jgi:hypothetical protein
MNYPFSTKKVLGSKETSDSSSALEEKKKTTTTIAKQNLGKSSRDGSLKKKRPKRIPKEFSEESNIEPETLPPVECVAPSLVSAAKDNLAEPGETKAKCKKKEKKILKSGKTKTKQSIQVETVLDLLGENEGGCIVTKLDSTDPEQLVGRLKNRNGTESEGHFNNFNFDIEGTVFDEVSEAGTKSTDVSSQSDYEGNTEDRRQYDHDRQSAVTSRLQRLLSEALAKLVTVTEERMLEKDNVLKVSTELVELKAEYYKTSHDICQLLGVLEEREKSLKKNENIVAALEIEVECQLDLQDSLHIKLDSANGEINKMDLEIVKLEDEVGTLQENHAEYEELQQELVKEKRKAAQRELSIHTLMEDGRGGVGALKEILMSQDYDASAMLSEKDDDIAALQKEVAQLRNIAIAGEYKAAVVAARNSLEVSQRQIGFLEEENEELLSAKENLEGEVIRVKANATKLAEESNAAQEELTLWTEAAHEWKRQTEAGECKRQTEAAEKQQDAGSPLPTGEITIDSSKALLLQAAMEHKRASRENLKQGKGWGLGGMFRAAKMVDHVEAEIRRLAIPTLKELDTGSPALADDATQAVENAKAFPQDMFPQGAMGSKTRSCEMVTDSPQALVLHVAIALFL